MMCFGDFFPFFIELSLKKIHQIYTVFSSLGPVGFHIYSFEIVGTISKQGLISVGTIRAGLNFHFLEFRVLLVEVSY